MAKENARKLLEQRKSPYEVNQERENQEKKLKKLEEDINRVIENPGLTDAQKKAVAAGTARAWYADLLGAPADLAGMALDYGAEGFKSIMPSKELTGYDLEKELGVDKFQQAMRDPVGGYKHLEEVGEDIGYIPPTTGTDLEEAARIAAGFVDPVPLPLTAGVFASNRAKTLPKLSKAKAEELETAYKPPQEIFNQTGFFRGPEGEWRFEISDKDMKIKPEFLKTKTEIWGGRPTSSYDENAVTYAKLSDVVEHPELFKAYPELEDIYIKFEPDAEGYRGYYSERGEMIPISNTPEMPPGGFKNADEERAFNKGISEKFPEEFRKVISVVAPTRQSEIARLDNIIKQERSNMVVAEKEIDELRTSAESRGKDWGDYVKEHHFAAKPVFKLEKAQEKIKDTLPELQRLPDGGPPDLEFSVKSTLTHEIQHAIQDIENLPPGGSVRTAYKDTQDAAVADILAKAKKKHQDERYLMDDFGMMSELDREKRLYDEKLQAMAMMDDVHYLQQLQKFILSDEPTRNARFIENSSFNYGLTIPEERMLGPRPKKHRRQEYAEYLRRKAKLYQKKVIDKYVPGPKGVYSQKRDRFNRLLGDLVEYTEKKGTATHPKEVGDQFLEEIRPVSDSEQMIKRTADGSQFDPMVVVDPVGLRFPSQGVDTGSVSTPYEQPNWLALGEKNVKNYVKRLARAADKHAEGAGMKRQIEAKFADLEKKRKDYNIYPNQGSDFEFYKRLAGEAEARAVQKRLELAEGYSTKLENLEPGVDQDLIDAEFLKLQEAKGKVPTEIYDVPKEELAITRRAIDPWKSAKAQAKTDARKMLAK